MCGGSWAQLGWEYEKGVGLAPPCPVPLQCPPLAWLLQVLGTPSAPGPLGLRVFQAGSEVSSGLFGFLNSTGMGGGVPLPHGVCLNAAPLLGPRLG